MLFKKISILLSIWVALLSCLTQVSAQQSNLEKIYVQTDRPLYFPGEMVWYKAYITNADGKVNSLSDIMMIDLMAPNGDVVKRATLKVAYGYAYGDFYLNEDWVGGTYTLRAYTTWLQNYGEEAYFEKEIVVQKVISPEVLLKLDFDKEAYGPASQVIAHFRANNLENNPLVNYEFAAVLQIKGETIIEQTLVTDAEGKQDIVFNLPADLNTTDVLITTRVPYKSSAESISRSVPIALYDIDLQFLPESGQAIIGTANTIAFKAVNQFGKPADVSGEIVDETGNLITTFSSYHDGMGAFVMTPTASKYYARLSEPYKATELQPLPEMLQNGTKFSVEENEDAFQIQIFSNSQSKLVLVVSSAYEEQLRTTISTSSFNKATFTLPKQALGIGIYKITLEDTKGVPLAERLVFANKDKQLQVKVSLAKDVYATREKVKVKVQTLNADQQPVPANLSVSVADNKLVTYADDKQDNILSQLLVSSELQGKIYKPSFYFKPDEPKAAKALNYVMLTQGWRSYIQSTIIPETAIYKPDALNIQYGKVIDGEGNGVQSHVMVFDLNSNKVLKLETDEDGVFSFSESKTGKVLVLAFTDDNTWVSIESGRYERNMSEGVLSYTGKVKVDQKIPQLASVLGKKIAKDDKKTTGTIDVAMDMDSSELSEVVVVGYGAVKKQSLTGAVKVIHSDNLEDKTAGVAQLLQGRVAGVSIANASGIYGNTAKISIRGASSVNGMEQPLVIIDGVPVSQNNAQSDPLGKLEANAIESVTVIKGAAAASLYGSQGGGGVIVVTTKKNSYWNSNRKVFYKRRRFKYATHFFNTYAPKIDYPATFYMPDYASTEIPEKRFDFRNTIYWNPVVQTDANGEASFEFYNSDAVTSFIIATEGIGANGIAGRNETTYASGKTLDIAFTLPNYMAVNDTVNIPVTITNTSATAVTGRLVFTLPGALKALNDVKAQRVTVPAKGYKVHMVKVVPVTTEKEVTVEVSFQGGEFTDHISKKGTIVSPYFPMYASASGNSNATYQVPVANIVPGSMHASFNVYTNILGNVMDGIDGIIRQPYGCFEQVSSTTYPNVLVLQYLRETGKSNPEIESKAMSYIKKGYEKLAGYETKKNGFEWYGHTPPHEALSAYGLMEFTEMKQVYNGVSEPMLQRTVTYLLSRKDGKGGFKQNRGKYGFSAAPENVNNAYIVYALSEAGVAGSKYELEYSTARTEALESTDSYRMALMACAAFNLGKTQDYEELLSKIIANLRNYGFEKLPVSATITRSYGNSRIVETAAFTVLALLKEVQYLELVTEGVSVITSKKTNYGFGSTQATAMALKALINYTKYHNENLFGEDISVTLSVNGKTINRKIVQNDKGKLVIDSLEGYFHEGNQEVSIAFSNGKQLPYSLQLNWDTQVPNSASDCKVAIATQIGNATAKVGETVRLTTLITNTTSNPLPMVTAVVGIPGGTQAQPWQLKEITEQLKADYVEVFDNYLVFYFKEMGPSETKTIQLDLQAEVPGTYVAPASTAYLYYTNELKHWIYGEKLVIE